MELHRHSWSPCPPPVQPFMAHRGRVWPKGPPCGPLGGRKRPIAATKVATLGPQAKSLLGNKGNNSSNPTQIIVREERTARIDRGTALHFNLSFENVNHRRGYCCSKKLKGEDFTVVYELTATYLLKVNRLRMVQNGSEWFPVDPA